MRSCIGIVHKDPDSDFGVSFPDFPGCISAGSTLAEAAALAAEALEGHVALMIEGRAFIPEPRGLASISTDPVFGDGVPILIPLPRGQATSEAA